MNEIEDAIARLGQWIKDYGHIKQPGFIDDMKLVLAELDRLKRVAAERELVLEQILGADGLMADKVERFRSALTKIQATHKGKIGDIARVALEGGK